MLDYLGGPSVVTRKNDVKESELREVASWEVLDQLVLKMRNGAGEPKNVGILLKMEMTRKWILPY